MSENDKSVSHEKAPWYRRRGTVVWALLLVGPFALPLVWYCPSFKRNIKILLSLGVIALSTVSYIYTPVLIDRLMQQLDETQTVSKGEN